MIQPRRFDERQNIHPTVDVDQHGKYVRYVEACIQAAITAALQVKGKCVNAYKTPVAQLITADNTQPVTEIQMPLKGIQLTQEFSKARIFHIRCECGEQ